MNIMKKSILTLHGKRAFTLVEMLIALVILGILVAIAIPVYNDVTQGANDNAFESNHSIIVSAINMYTTAHNGKYPPHAYSLIERGYLLDEKGTAPANASTLSVSAGADIAIIFTKPEGASYIYEGSADGKSFTLTSTYNDLTYTYTKGTTTPETTA